jgi:hypothetical protein
MTDRLSLGLLSSLYFEKEKQMRAEDEEEE